MTFYFMRSVVYMLMVLILFSCRKEKTSFSSTIEIISPQEFTIFSALDTIDVKANIYNSDDQKIYVSVYVCNQDRQVVSGVWTSSYTNELITINVSIILTERWLPAGEYFVIISVNNGNENTWAQQKILIQAIPKRMKGLIVGVANQMACDVYVSDTNFVFEKVLTLYDVQDALYDYVNARFISIHSSGKVRFYFYPDWVIQNEITNLNKVGSPFRFDCEWAYPYVYITNANGYIYGIDKDANIRQTIRTTFSPYRIEKLENTWALLSNNYPQITSWIEVPSMLKSYSFNGSLEDILGLDKKSWLVIEQKTSSVVLHNYITEINYLNQKNEILGVTYKGALNIQNHIFLLLSDGIYELEMPYFGLQKVITGIFKKFKYDDTKGIIYACNNNELYLISQQNYQSLHSVLLPGEIIFFDFIYE
ncbi:MAG: hypothetical protein N2449_09990 [Bacteroidales bacterium]|nr:hypothetical protein [Bacteroidales bacterium]